MGYKKFSSDPKNVSWGFIPKINVFSQIRYEIRHEIRYEMGQKTLEKISAINPHRKFFPI